jgi:hypothetical protein
MMGVRISNFDVFWLFHRALSRMWKIKRSFLDIILLKINVLCFLVTSRKFNKKKLAYDS